jgi:hypothetical protein
MFKAENSCPKCPLYASPNPKFMRDANAKFEEFKYIEGFNAKWCKCKCKIWIVNLGIQHAMGEIKYEITTDLPVGKGSKF